jgi:hypothetical protein
VTNPANQPVTSAASVKPGGRLRLHFGDGEVDAVAQAGGGAVAEAGSGAVAEAGSGAVAQTGGGAVTRAGGGASGKAVAQAGGGSPRPRPPVVQERLDL